MGRERSPAWVGQGNAIGEGGDLMGAVGHAPATLRALCCGLSEERRSLRLLPKAPSTETASRAAVGSRAANHPLGL